MALRPLFCLFFSGRLRQVSLYTELKLWSFGHSECKKALALSSFYLIVLNHEVVAFTGYLATTTKF